MKGFQSLVRLELVNLFGLNTYRYTKDPKEKKKKLALLIALGFVGVVLMGYAGVTAYALADFGLADKIPTGICAAAGVGCHEGQISDL